MTPGCTHPGEPAFSTRPSTIAWTASRLRQPWVHLRLCLFVRTLPRPLSIFDGFMRDIVEGHGS